MKNNQYEELKEQINDLGRSVDELLDDFAFLNRRIRQIMNVLDEIAPISINFSSRYDKLDQDKFTTIRPVSYISKKGLSPSRIELQPLVSITIRGKFYCWARVERVETKRICDINVDLLRKDIAPEPCNSHKDFVDYLNRLYASIYGFGNNRETTLKAIIYLRRIK